jgi:hypothetical protein
MSFILDFDQVNLGDIIISSGTSFGAQFIKAGTWSKDTHAMIYVGHTMIHAVPKGGVFSKNPQRELFKSKDHVKVFRVKNKLSLDTLNSICDHARALVGSIYSVKEAVLTKKHAKSSTDAQTKMQFCSRLVAQAYASQDIEIVNNPNYCSPKELSNSSSLQEVKDAIRKASDDEIKFSKTTDPTLENQKVTYDWLNKSREIANALDFEIQTVNDVSIFIKAHPTQDSVICEFIKNSGYLDHYQCDLKLNPFRYNSEEFIEYFSNENIDLENGVIGELEKEPGLIDHFYRNYSAHNQMHKQTSFNYYKLHVELYSNILLLIKERLVVMYNILPAPINVKLKTHICVLIQTIDEIVI